MFRSARSVSRLARFAAPKHHAASFCTTRPEPQVAETLMQIGTRRIFDHDHDMYRELCRNFYKDNVTPFEKDWEADGHVSREVWTQAGANGMLGVTVPEEYGGLGLDAKYAAVHWEEQSYALSSGVGFSLHSEIVCPYIVHYGSEEMKRNYLPKLISGEWISAIAMTEPGAGSDLQGMRTNAVKDGDDYIINGSKTFITNGWHADLVIVCAKTDPTAGAKGISLFAVETSTPGFIKGRKLKKMGMKSQDTAELFFEDMRVPASALIGGVEGKGFPQLMTELPQERLLIAVGGLAAAEACFEITRSYVNERKAFGKPIGTLQTIKHNMAEMKTELAMARAFTDRCIELLNDKKLDSVSASMAKYWVTDLQCSVIDRCVQLHGGWGYMWEYPVCRAFVDARVQRIYGGTNEIMKELIGRGI